MPDLDWWNDHVRAEFDSMLDFWFARGVAGFRIDVAHRTVTRRVVEDARGRGYRRYPPADVPAHALLRRWRQRADAWDPPRLLVGETYVMDVGEMAAFYGNGSDQLHLAFNFPFVFAGLGAAALRRVVEETETRLPPASVARLDALEPRRRPLPHALVRRRRAQGALRSAPAADPARDAFPVLRRRDRDGAGRRAAGARPRPGREAHARAGPRRLPDANAVERADDGAGFTRSRVEPWLPFGDHRVRNVEVAAGGRTPRCLSLPRPDRPAARVDRPARGRVRRVARPGVLAFRRGEGTVVAPQPVAAARARARLEGEIALATDRVRDGERVDGVLTLEPWSGAVVAGGGSSRQPSSSSHRRAVNCVADRVGVCSAIPLVWSRVAARDYGRWIGRRIPPSSSVVSGWCSRRPPGRSSSPRVFACSPRPRPRRRGGRPGRVPPRGCFALLPPPSSCLGAGGVLVGGVPLPCLLAPPAPPLASRLPSPLFALRGSWGFGTLAPPAPAFPFLYPPPSSSAPRPLSGGTGTSSCFSRDSCSRTPAPS